MRNLKYQFLRAINGSFRERMDKHSDKANKMRNTNKIYSYSSRKNLIKMSSNFSNYMREHYPEVKYVKDIQPDHIQNFLVSKNNGECSSITLSQYKAQLCKLSKVVNAQYGCDTDYTNGVVVPNSIKNGGGKIRNVMMLEKDYKTLLDNSTNDNFKNGLQLSYHCGLRASEVSKVQKRDYDVSNQTLQIVDSKGKRSRTIQLNDKQNKVVKSIMDKLDKPKDRVCSVQTESLQQSFRRELKKNGLSEKYTDTSFHSCRKSAATRHYQECRESGKSVQQSLDATSKYLGHNENRNDLMREYVCCEIV